MRSDFHALNKDFSNVRKILGKKIEGTPLTYDQGIRIYLWDKAGYDIPGNFNKTILNKVLNEIKRDSELRTYADSLLVITKMEKWKKPGSKWLNSSILGDMYTLTDGKFRHKFLQDWINNVDAVFTKENLDRSEYLYGKKHRKALENAILRMKNGKNRTAPEGAELPGQRHVRNWVNASIGVIMFFNFRSALFQLISTANYVNLVGPNNPMNAVLAVLNFPQYRKDIKKIFTSPFLKERREGLRNDVNLAEMETEARGSVSKVLNACLLYTSPSPRD